VPIFLEPDQRFPIVLASDKDKPVESRPTFFAKSQSMRGQRRICNVLDRMTSDESVKPDELFDDALNVLSEVLVGWKNMGDNAFGRDGLEAVLSYAESRELMRLVAYNSHVDPEEKKS
jgi:hypothetical protein